jgi:hypothetical protein
MVSERGMKKLFVLLPILLAAVTFSPIDYERSLTLRVEGLLQQHPSVKSYRYKGSGWFEFTNDDGYTWFRNFGDCKTTGGLKPKKIISIDLRKIDTTGFSGMFRVISEVPLGLSWRPPVGSMIVNDGSCELTAHVYQPKAVNADLRLFKSTPLRTDFKEVLTYPNIFVAQGAEDIDNDGRIEIIGDSLGSIYTFEGSAPGRLDMRLSHVWAGKCGDEQVLRIADFDRDGRLELLQKQFGNGFLGPVIIKYDAVRSQLINPFRATYPGYPEFRAYWAVGDFDQDGEKEFVTAQIDGIVCFMEHASGDSSYALVFKDTTRYINAYFHVEGNDLDGDGRPECFIGSDNTNGLNNIAVYETTGNNSYEVTAWIELFPLGTFQWQTIWTGDVTGDGKDELVLSSAGALIVLGARGNDDWQILWYTYFTTETSHRLFDVDQDGVMEILLSLKDSVTHYTKIIKYTRITEAHETPSSAQGIRLEAYPQPSTDRVTLQTSIPGKDVQQIALYSLLGELVRTIDVHCVDGSGFWTSVPTATLPNGMYVVVLKCHFVRIVKQILVIH